MEQEILRDDTEGLIADSMKLNGGKPYHSEKNVKRVVKRLLQQHAWKSRMPPSNMYGEGGLADFLCWRTGIFMAIETKFGKNKPTINQKRFLNEVMIEGCFGFVVDDMNIAWFATWLTVFDRSIERVMNHQKEDPADAIELLNAVRALTVDIA